MVEEQPRKRWWRRRSAAAPVALTRLCPSCKLTGPARLLPGEVCATCAAQRAWADAESAGVLVIDEKAIRDALDRRAGARVAWSHHARVWLPAAVSIATATLAACALRAHLAPRAIGPLHSLIADLDSAAWRAFWIGLGCVIAGVLALRSMRNGRHFRRLVPLTIHALAIVIGAASVVLAGMQLISPDPYSGHHDTMPARENTGLTSVGDRISAATVVIVAPDGDGDARFAALGTGSIVGTHANRAWILTCSHVAMPYAAVGSWRKPADAQPVWVALSDGRQGRALVRWAAPPPIDVAVLELAIDAPPAPVTFAKDVGSIDVDGSVMFVPNPFREGWLLHRGRLLRKEEHRSPAGTYSLLVTDLPLIPGDSGSGLFDGRGELIGLNTWVKYEDGNAHGISLPADAMAVLADAIEHGQLDKLDQLQPSKGP